MIGAIVEISSMLIGALLIGMFITWQYWKKKYNENNDANLKIIHSKEQQIIAHTKEEKRLNQELTETERALNEKDAEIKTLQSDLDGTRSANKQLEDEIKSLKTTVQNLTSQNEKLTSDLKAEKETSASLQKEVEAKSTKEPEKAKAPKTTKNKSKSNLQSKIMEDHSYYRTIQGKKYKDKPLQMAEQAVAGQGDGRISKADAEEIFSTISDGHQYTDIEKNTLKYLRDNFRWTPEADELFRHEVRVWAAKGHKLD